MSISYVHLQRIYYNFLQRGTGMLHDKTTSYPIWSIASPFYAYY